MRNTMPLLRRFLSKLVHDILPAALASLVGGFLLSHYGLGRAPQAPSVAAVPASTEMMQLLDDEHVLVANYLKARLADEKRQLATAENPPTAAAEPPQSAPAAPQASATAMAAVKASARAKGPVVGASLPPLVIAQTSQAGLPSASALPSESAKPAAREDDSLFAKTIGIKDRVIAATQRAVSAIGSIPTWFGTIGDRGGGQEIAPGEIVPRPPAELVRAS